MDKTVKELTNRKNPRRATAIDIGESFHKSKHIIPRGNPAPLTTIRQVVGKMLVERWANVSCRVPVSIHVETNSPTLAPRGNIFGSSVFLLPPFQARFENSSPPFCQI